MAAASAVENIAPVTGESKSARKKKAKAEAAASSANGVERAATPLANDAAKDESVVAEGDNDHPYRA